MQHALFQNCFHGGAFFSALGERFDHLERQQTIINADVLDAWFPPAPEVLQAITADLPWLLRTSPPTHCSGLLEALALAQGVHPENILPGAGSSDLIFRVLREWLNPSSRVLILDPTYGEYSHVLQHVIGCQVSRFPLRRDEGYLVSVHRLRAVLQGGWDLVVLVNPNSPTGRHLHREEMRELLSDLPPRTRVWIDETYIDYTGERQSMESLAANHAQIVVCKSMSKVYALSGARVAYLCGSRALLDPLRAVTPPWVIGLPSQLAAVRALEQPGYYRQRYAETHRLRADLAGQLTALGWEVVPGVANFLLCHLPAGGLTAAQLTQHCAERNLFLRDASRLGASLGPYAIRIAVKDAATNHRMLEILRTFSARRDGSAPASPVGRIPNALIAP